MTFWLWWILLAPAEAATELTLGRTMALAVERNPNLASAELSEAIAAIGASRARLDRFSGQVTANGGLDLGVVKPWGEPGYGQSGASWDTRVTVGVPLYAGGRVQAAIDQADASRSIARLQSELSQRDLVRAAYTAYWNIRGFELQIAASEEGLQSTEEALAIIRSKADAGLAAGFDVNRSTVDLLSQQEGLIQQRAALVQSEQDLLRLLHFVDDDVVLVSDPPAPRADPVALPADPLAGRPELERQALSAAQAEASVRLARSASLPTVSLTGTTGVGAAAAGGGPDVTFPTLGGGSTVVQPEAIDLGDLGRPALDADGVGLQLTWNPFDLLRTKHSVDQARLSAKQVEAQSGAERDALQAELRAATARLDSLRARLPLVDQQLALARDNQTIVQDLYSQGTASILDLFNAQSSFRAAAIQEAALAVNLATAELDLRWLLGEDVTGASP